MTSGGPDQGGVRSMAAQGAQGPPPQGPGQLLPVCQLQLNQEPPRGVASPSGQCSCLGPGICSCSWGPWGPSDTPNIWSAREGAHLRFGESRFGVEVLGGGGSRGSPWVMKFLVMGLGGWMRGLVTPNHQTALLIFCSTS